MNHKRIKEIDRIIPNEIKADIIFTIVYGKYAYQVDQNYNGDIDLLVVTKKNPTKSYINLISSNLIEFSKFNNLEIDTEVSYDRKLMVSENRLKRIFELNSFDLMNEPHVRIVKDNDVDYLNSDLFLDRLFLNAFTTINVLINGNTKKYDYYTKKAFNSIIKLATAINKSSNTLENLVNCLFPQCNVYYKDYLGYEKNEQIESHLIKMFKKYNKEII